MGYLAGSSCCRPVDLLQQVVHCGELCMASPTQSFLAGIQGVFGPSLLANNEWSDTVQREFHGRLHKVSRPSAALAGFDL